MSSKTTVMSFGDGSQRCSGFPHFFCHGIRFLRAHSYPQPPLRRFLYRRRSLPLPRRHFPRPPLGLGPEYSVPAWCGYDQDMRSPYFVDGVLGLSNGQSNIVGQLSKMGFKNAHGHCFGTNRRGFVFIGDRATPSGTVWTAMSQNQENHYILGPADLVVGNAIVAKNLKVVFDSGSTYTYLNENTYQATLSLVNKGLSGKNLMNVKDANLPVCWSRGAPFRSFDEVKSYFSTLFLNFHNNARFMLPPEAYLIISSYGNVCFGILNSREANMDSNIVGAIAFQDKLLIYDNEQNRVGWVPNNCI